MVSYNYLMQVTFFQQGTIPCVSKDGRFIMEAPYRVCSPYMVELIKLKIDLLRMTWLLLCKIFVSMGST